MACMPRPTTRLQTGRSWTGCSTSVKRQSRAQSKFVRQALLIASTRTRALGGSSPGFAICASSPDGPACVDAPVYSRELREAASENCRCGDLVMKGTASKKTELSKRGKQPGTYRRIVTGNVNGKAVVQSDEPLPAYEFRTVPGYEHTLIWVNPATRISAKSKGLTGIPTRSGTWRHKPALRDVSARFILRGSIFRWRGRSKRSIGSSEGISRPLRK